MPGIADAIGSAAAMSNPYAAAASAAINTAIGVAQIIKGGQQKREAKSMQAKTVRPFKRIEQGYKDNLNLTESRASQGLSDGAMTVYENNMNRTFTTGVDAILRGAGDINNIADLYDSAEDNFAQLALLEEEVRAKNTQNFLLASEAYAEKEGEQWMVNEWGPYRDRMQAIAELRSQAQQNTNAGLNSIGSGVNNFLTATRGQGEADKVFGATDPGGGATAGRTTNVGAPTRTSYSGPTLPGQVPARRGVTSIYSGSVGTNWDEIGSLYGSMYPLKR